MSKQVATREQWPEELLLRLQEAQAKSGYVSAETMAALAKLLDIPLNDVYGVASFYSFIATRPLGRNIIRVCKSLPCYLKGGESILAKLQQELGIGPGETTPDGRFSLELANCIGLCDQAPAMLINDDAHVELTPSKITRILKGYK